MANENRVKILTLKIQNFKDQLTAFENYISNFDKDTATEIELQLRSSNLSYSFVNFDDLYIEINSIKENTLPIDEKLEIENRYFAIFSEAQKLITGIKQKAHSTQLESTLNQTNLLNESISKVKFPSKSLPTFSGKYEDFVSFKNRFQSMVESQKHLTELDKFDYLITALKGSEAENKLNIIIASETAYEEAWKILEKAYGSKRILLAYHLNKLLNLPKIEKQNYKLLTNLTDTALQHVESLKSLKLEIPSEAIVVLLENKLDTHTLELWDRELRDDDLPKLDKFTDFLYQLSARLSRRDREKSSTTVRNEQPSNKKPRFEKNDKKVHAFLTQNKSSLNCVLCPDKQHPLYTCPNFNTLAVNSRFDLAKKYHLCFNCLKKHTKNDCKSKSTCKNCNKRHHSLLHGYWNKNSDKSNDSKKD